MSGAASDMVMSLEEARRLLGVSAPTLRKAIRGGQVPAIRMGARVLIPRARFVAWLAGASAEALPQHQTGQAGTAAD
jgi:excisionase family DNA binding protein